MSEAMSIEPASVTIQAVMVSNKNMTVTVYNQMPTLDFYGAAVEWNYGSGPLTPLWIINRCPSGCGANDYRFSDHVHVLCARDGSPYVTIVPQSMWPQAVRERGDHLREAQHRFMADFLVVCRKLPQGYIGVGK